MDRLIKWCGGYVLVELSGDTPERLINLCGYNGINVWELVCIERKYRFYVRRQDFKRLVDYVRKSRNRLIVLEKRGLPFGARRHRHRKSLVYGILVCLFLLYALSLHIWEIQFDGNSYFTDELLEKTLLQEGYKRGMRKSQIVCDDLEMRLREIYPEITWVSAQISGTRMLIQIRENTGILMVEETEEEPCDLVATQDGVIQSIVTRSGTPMVKAGDTVTKGQVLIRGVVELYNDSKEKVGEHLVAADGDILVQTEVPYEDHFDLEHSVKWYTGEQRYRLEVICFGYKVTLDLIGSLKETGVSDGSGQEPSLLLETLLRKIPILKKVPFLYSFSKYDIVTIYGQVRIMDQFFIPISWQLTTLREYEESTAIYSKSQAFSLAEEKCAGFFEKLLEKGVQIIEKNVRIDMIGAECVAEGTVTVIGPISEAVPISQNTVHQEETNN